MAVSEALSITPSTFGAGLAADDLILTLYFTALYSLAKNIPPDAGDGGSAPAGAGGAGAAGPGSGGGHGGGAERVINVSTLWARGSWLALACLQTPLGAGSRRHGGDCPVCQLSM
jgi:hypothetical protein